MAPDSFLVAFETTKGSFEVMAHREWSPLAADRFHELVAAGTFDGIRIFRVVPDWVAQFGLTGDSAVDRAWRRQPVPDEAVRVANTRGRIAFARSGPETRTQQIFINLKDNSQRLDANVVNGVRGYPPFAEVVRGMAVVARLESKYGEAPGRLQGEISRTGWATVDAQFPDLDRIVKARITREWPGR
jgi:cyclophilin family peptidyl-prolyl cis-trans isomerase